MVAARYDESPAVMAALIAAGSPVNTRGDQG